MLLLLHLSLASLLLVASGSPSELEQANLAELSYERLHELAVESQLGAGRLRAQKSLQTRPRVQLDGLYDFCLDQPSPKSRGLAEQWQSRELRSVCPPSDLYRMPVPSAFNELTSNASVRDHIGWLWYQRQVEAHHLPAGAWYLQFESANYLALVWVDGKLAGSHVGGYLPFLVRVDQLLAGGERSFRLTVAVSNLLTDQTIPSGHLEDLSGQVGRPFFKFVPDFDFFHFAGLLGQVHLFSVTPELHISSVEVHEPADGPLRFQVCFQRPAPQWARLRLRVSTKAGVPAPAPEQEQLVAALSECASLELDASRLDVWEPARGRPNHLAAVYLAQVELELLDEELKAIKQVDRYELPFGVLRGARQRYLAARNERQPDHLPLQGFGMHMEAPGGFTGRYMSPAAIQKDLYLLKAMGVTLIRSSHYPYSSEYLEACDEHGILVVAECQAVGLHSFGLGEKLALHQQLLREMMERDQHHASVLAWSVANEPESQLPEAAPYFARLLGFARAQLAQYGAGAGRPLTAALAQSWRQDRVAGELDLVMLNFYFGWYEQLGVLAAVRRPLLAALAGWASKHPGKPLLVSEFGAEAQQGQHSLTGAPFSEEYQRDLLLEHERIFDELWSSLTCSSGTCSSDNSTCTRDQCSELGASCPEKRATAAALRGAMIWNFADFSTHWSLQRPRGNQKGVFSGERAPKLAAEAVRRVYLGRLAA